MLLDLTLQGLHVAVAVENAGVGRVQGGQAVQLRLQGQGLFAGQSDHALHAVDPRLVQDALQGADLIGLGGHHQLAAAVMGHAMGVQERIEPPPALDAQPRAQRTGAVVEPAVDDL